MKFRTRINTFKINCESNKRKMELTKFEAIDTIDVNGRIVNIAYEEEDNIKSVEIAPIKIVLIDKYMDVVQSNLGRIFIFEYGLLLPGKGDKKECSAMEVDTESGETKDGDNENASSGAIEIIFSDENRSNNNIYTIKSIEVE